MSADITLTALALVERLLMEDAEGVKALAQVTPPEEVGMLATALATFLAAHLATTYGTEDKALEAVARWRSLALRAASE